MKNSIQDLEDLIQALDQLDLDKSLKKAGLDYNLRRFGEQIITKIVICLTSSEQVYPFSCSKLTTPQLLTIQKFLSKYNFRIEYVLESKNLYYYRISPNWR